MVKNIEHILSNFEQNADTHGGVDPRRNLPSGSTVRSQEPFDIDTFITVISEKKDANSREKVRNATIITIVIFRALRFSDKESYKQQYFQQQLI